MQIRTKNIRFQALIVHIYLVFIFNVIQTSFSFNFKQDNIGDASDQDVFSKSSNLNCCEEIMTIESSMHPEGYLKVPALYEEMVDPKNSNKIIECIYKFSGKPGERIQLFYEDFDLYYPYDIYKFNKIDCRYSDSICLKFYENGDTSLAEKISDMSKSQSISLESHNYDLCNCINVSYTPRQIISAGNFLQIRFKSVQRLFDTSAASMHSKNVYRGYLLRYRFTKDYGLDIKSSGYLDPLGACKVFFYSTTKRDGYFSSPNYPGLYPRDVHCHYFFFGQSTEKVQITFHTFDVEGVEQCLPDTKSDYVELSNFQNQDRIYSRFCGINKPGSIMSDGSFFHVTFYSNNVFDGKGFQASYYFVNSNSYNDNARKSLPSSEKNSVSSVSKSASAEANFQDNKANHLETNSFVLFFLILAKLIN